MKHEKTPLGGIPLGKSAVVTELLAGGALRRRLFDIGLTPGTHVKSLHKSPAGDPVAYFIRGAVIAIRAEDAKLILVEEV